MHFVQFFQVKDCRYLQEIEIIFAGITKIGDVAKEGGTPVIVLADTAVEQQVVSGRPSCSRDTGCVAWTCQLLHRRDTDRERRKVRYERIDRRSSYVAIRHPVARDKRRYWAVRDSSGQ